MSRSNKKRRQIVTKALLFKLFGLVKGIALQAMCLDYISRDLQGKPWIFIKAGHDLFEELCRL